MTVASMAVNVASMALTIASVARVTDQMEPPVLENAITLSVIRAGRRRIFLRFPIQAELSFEEGLWCCELEEFHIMGFGPTQDDAIIAFMEDFALTYDTLSNEGDENLTKDAIRLRDWLRAINGRQEIDQVWAFGTKYSALTMAFAVPQLLVADSVLDRAEVYIAGVEPLGKRDGYVIDAPRLVGLI
jgi:hypothetical protein